MVVEPLADRSVELLLEEVIYLGFIEARQFLFAFDEDRALQQIRVFEHELDRLVFGRRLLLHVFLFVKRRAGT